MSSMTSLPGLPPAPPAVSKSIPEHWHFSTRTKLMHLAKRIGRGLEVAASMVLPICPNRRVAREVRVGDCAVRYYRHWPSDAKVLADWEALSQHTQGSTVFQSAPWQQAAAIIPDALGTLRLLTVHDGDRLVAVLPLERRWGGRWRTNGFISTAFHDPLINPACAPKAWDSILRAIPKLDRRFHSLTFELLSPDATCLSILPSLATAAGFKVEDTALTTKDASIELAPTFDGYLSRLDGHNRRELRRKMRKVEENGFGKFVVNDTEESVAKALPELLDLMERDGGGKGRKTKWLYRRHMRLAAPTLARTGRLVVYQLLIDGKLAAGNIALPQGNRQLMFNGAMADEFRKHSPGIVLWGMILRRACELGQPSIDLLRGLSTYKHELGAVDRPLHRLTLTR